MLSVLTEVVNVIPFLRFISQKSPESVPIHRNRTPSLTHLTGYARLPYTWNLRLNFVVVDATPGNVPRICLVVRTVSACVPDVPCHCKKNAPLLSPFLTNSSP